MPNYMSLHILYHFTFKDTWHGPRKPLDKRHIRCLETYITKYNRENNLEIMARQYSNISKWTMNHDLDNKIPKKL